VYNAPDFDQVFTVHANNQHLPHVT